MSVIRRNIAANYAGQIYVSVIGIVVVPLYVRFMGAEAYGLIGFYAVLQTWFTLLDMGLTPTLSRQAARFRGNAVNSFELRGLLRALEIVFGFVALFGSAGMIAGAGLISTKWLNIQVLPLSEVQDCVRFIAVIISLRWISDLYRGIISGLEQFVWLNVFNTVIATLRFVVVFLVFAYLGTSPTRFFAYQLAVAVVELMWLIIKTYRLLPIESQRAATRSIWKRLSSNLGFSISIAFSALIWVLATQSDKLLLSKLLSLTEYAYYTLAVLVASGLLIITAPISGAILPRMVALNAESNHSEMIRLYRGATQFVAVVAFPIAAILFLFARPILWVWTGDAQVAGAASGILALYAVGNAILAVSSFPYYLQFAKGNLKLHVAGSIFFILLLIPSLLWCTAKFGPVGAGYAWCWVNAAYFVCWIPVVHSHLIQGLHLKWLLRDVGVILGVTLLCAAVVHRFVPIPHDRINAALIITVCGATMILVSGIASPRMRQVGADLLRKQARQGMA